MDKSSTGKKASKLPSIAVGFTYGPKKQSLSSSQFTESRPVVRRERMCIFADEDGMNETPTGYSSRSGLRTPPEIRRAIHDAIFEYSLEAASESKRSVSSSKSPSQGSKSETLLPLVTSSGKRHHQQFRRNEAHATERPASREIRATGNKVSRYLLDRSEKEATSLRFEESNSRPQTEHNFKSVSVSPQQQVGPVHTHADPDRLRAEYHAHRETSKEDKASMSSAAIMSETDLILSEMSTKEIEETQHAINSLTLDKKAEFNERYKTATTSLYTYPEPSDEMKTPRTLYLRDIVQRNLLPLPLILRQGVEQRGLFLAHRGIGDEYMLSICEVLETLPAIEVINLADNRLTDSSIMILSSKLSKLSHLTYLNLSANDVDDSSVSLRDYLASNKCTLRKFVLDAADLDDVECASMSEAIVENKTLVSLSLCRNKIGDMELLNVVHPDLITGGEAIGNILTKNKTLTELDLRWNSIRLGSADTLSASLRFNDTLKTLKLGNNALGEHGIEVLGSSLKVNKALTYLDISNNGINPKATSVLSNALMYNHTLQHLVLDGNILGYVGTQSLIASVQRAAGEHRTLNISFERCDCEKVDPNVFDPANPTGVWKVDLSEPYGQMVIDECIYLCNHKSGCNFVRLEYNPSGAAHIPIDLTHSCSSSTAKNRFDEGEFRLSSKLFCKLLFEKKFDEAPITMKNLLKMFNFVLKPELIKSVAMKVNDNWQKKVDEGFCFYDDLSDCLIFEIFQALFMIADTDQSGFVSAEELRYVFGLVGVYLSDREYVDVLKEFDPDGSGEVDIDEFTNAMVHHFCQTTVPKGELVEKSTNRPWQVPGSGHATIEVTCKVELPGIFSILKRDGMNATIQAIQSAKTLDQRMIIFNHVVNSPFFYMSAIHAQQLFDELSNGSDSAIDLIVDILPSIVNDKHVRKFIEMTLTEEGKLYLRCKIGSIYNAYVGNPSGHYLFDLKKRTHRVAVKKLSAISVTESNFIESQNINTSQFGDPSSLRNTTLNNELVHAHGEWIAKLPPSGKFRCDFVSTDRPRTGTKPCSEARFRRMIQRMDLRELVMTKFSLDQCTSPEEKSSVVHNMMTTLPSFFNITFLRGAYYEMMETSFFFYDTVVYEKERMRDFSRPGYSDTSRPTTPSDMKVENKPDADNLMYADIYPMAYHKLLILQVMLPGYYFSVQQVQELMYMFPETDFLRVQLLVTVFSKIIDLENLHNIIDNIFNHEERLEACHRLGVLNIFDPMNPDRYYKLDLRRWDHREVVKWLVKLAAAEPGDNWLDVSYRWAKYDLPVPGWLLPVGWTLPDKFDKAGEAIDGPRTFGWLILTYTSLGDGCSPNIAARRYLRNTRTIFGVLKLV